MVWGPLQIFVRAVRVVVCTALLVACASVQNNPINQPLSDDGAPVAAQLGPGIRGMADASAGEFGDAARSDETVVALSFSGGGARAAAFSYGVLTGFDETQVPSIHSRSLLDHVDFVTGVSGGSIIAAYFGLKKRAAMADFKQRFFDRNPEQGLQMDLSLLNIAKGLQGGINDTSQLPRWLDDNLFEHATFKSLLTPGGPRVWINASDIYNRTPFVFSRTAFSALCSDLANYPISLAVAASAAVPVVFAPVVIKNFTGGTCPLPLPHWVEQVRKDPAAPPLLKIYANALQRYRSGEVRYVKLLDGGIVDNYGLAPITIARLVSDRAYEPLSPIEAVKLRRFFFVVVDAGRGPSGSWVQTVEGPTGANLITAASDTATESGAVGSFSAFEDMMNTWQAQLIKWRCGLSAAERQRYGAPAGWNCRDARLFLTRLSFDDLGPERSAALNAVETRFKLPPDQVDMLIAAGHDVLLSNGVFRKFLNSMGQRPAAPPPRNGPVATPTARLQQAEAQ
jgi:NTE family protein